MHKINCNNLLMKYQVLLTVSELAECVATERGIREKGAVSFAR